MATAFSRNVSATKEQWTYEVRLGEGMWLVAAASLSVLIAAAMTIVLTGLSRATAPTVTVMTAGVMALAARAIVRTVVTIDRTRGFVSIKTGGYLWNRQRVCALGEFERVAIWERRKLLNAGYYTTQYSVVLLGGKGALPLLTTDDERAASVVRDEVTLFLYFRS
jgi:hypothetical protein